MSEEEKKFYRNKSQWGGTYRNGYIHYDTFKGRVSARLGNPDKRR